MSGVEIVKSFSDDRDYRYLGTTASICLSVYLSVRPSVRQVSLSFYRPQVSLQASLA